MLGFLVGIQVRSGAMNWVCYSYKNKKELAYRSSGSDGLEGLKAALEDGNVNYALIRVEGNVRPDKPISHACANQYTCTRHGSKVQSIYVLLPLPSVLYLAERVANPLFPNNCYSALGESVLKPVVFSFCFVIEATIYTWSRRSNIPILKLLL